MRALLAALSLSAAYPGAWATVAPRSFFDTFPGAGHHWTAALPAYNAHLIADVGAFYLAFALFSALHLAFHVTHLDGFSTTDAVAQTASLAAVLVASLGAVALARRRPSPAAS